MERLVRSLGDIEVGGVILVFLHSDHVVVGVVVMHRGEQDLMVLLAGGGVVLVLIHLNSFRQVLAHVVMVGGDGPSQLHFMEGLGIDNLRNGVL